MKTVSHDCGYILYSWIEENSPVYYPYNGQEQVENCPFCGKTLAGDLPETKAKPILWASRHQLDPEAARALEERFGKVTVLSQELLWPADASECLKLARRLDAMYAVLAGVWPAQAWEAFFNMHAAGELEAYIASPVSEPVKEADGQKVRAFRFVRWAIV